MMRPPGYAINNIAIVKQARSRGWIVSKDPNAVTRTSRTTWRAKGMTTPAGEPVADKIVTLDENGWQWKDV